MISREMAARVAVQLLLDRDLTEMSTDEKDPVAPLRAIIEAYNRVQRQVLASATPNLDGLGSFMTDEEGK